MEVTLTSSLDLTEITTKIQNNHLHNQFKTIWTEVLKPRIYRRSHMETGRKGRDMKRAQLPQAATKIPEGHLSCKGLPWGVSGLNSMPGSLAQSTRARNRHLYNIWLWKSVRITVHQTETGPLKGPMYKISFAAIQPGLCCQDSGRARADGTLLTWKEIGVCGSGERAERTTTRISVLCHSSTPQIPFFLGQALPSLLHQPGGME